MLRLRKSTGEGVTRYVLAVVIGLFTVMQYASAQTYPARTVRLVEPFPSGAVPMRWHGRLPSGFRPS